MSLTLDDHKDSGGHEIFWDTLSFSYGSSAFNATHSNVALISCHKATEKVVAIYPSILKVWTIRIQKISPQYLKPLKENIKLNAITITIYWTHNPCHVYTGVQRDALFFRLKCWDTHKMLTLVIINSGWIVDHFWLQLCACLYLPIFLQKTFSLYKKKN